MFEVEYHRCTRQCAGTGRELTPGEVIYSALVQQGGEVVRVDYAEEQWKGPPEGAIGHWKSRMPEPNAVKPHWAPNDVLLHYFEQLGADREKQDVRYVLGLLMIRRRILRHEETETNESGHEVMLLHCPRNENEYRLTVVQPERSRLDEIQEELAKFLQSSD